MSEDDGMSGIEIDEATKAQGELSRKLWDQLLDIHNETKMAQEVLWWMLKSLEPNHEKWGEAFYHACCEWDV